MGHRLVDATITEAVLWAHQPLDTDLLDALTGCLPVPGCDSAVPVLPPGAYGATVLRPLVPQAAVLEPFTWAAHRSLSDLPARPGGSIVDPHGVPLGAPYPDAVLPPGWTRECAAWLPPRPLDPAQLDRALDALPPEARLRLLDPHGTLDPTTLEPILAHDGSARLTLVLEDARGLALATALAALGRADGPTIRTALLGHGRRTGVPATEMLLPHQAAALRPLAERAALVTGRTIPPEHPLWGSRRNEIAEAERLRDAPPDSIPRWNPATLPHLLEARLQEFGLDADAETLDRLAVALVARLRPGEHADGPVLYAFLATHLDLIGARDTRTGRT